MAEIVYNVRSAERAPECVKIHKKVTDLIGELGPGRILDVGCGAGDMVADLLSRNFDALGIEPTDLAEIAEQRCGSERIVRGSCYADYDNFQLGKFDLIVSSEVIEHLHQPRKLVSFARRGLYSGGYFIVTTPHYGHYWRNLFISLTNRWDYHHTALWDGGHIKFFSKKSLETILGEQGFEVVRWTTVRSRRMPIFPMCLIAIARLSRKGMEC